MNCNQAVVLNHENTMVLSNESVNSVSLFFMIRRLSLKKGVRYQWKELRVSTESFAWNKNFK